MWISGSVVTILLPFMLFQGKIFTISDIKIGNFYVNAEIQAYCYF